VTEPSPTLTASPEPLVVALAATGDRAAFGELVRRRQSWVRTLMRRCCGNVALADDLAQQVFLRAWQDISALKNPRGFATWLRTLAINIWRQHLRKNDPLRNAESEVETKQATASDSGLALDLDNALAALSAQSRLCVVLSYHEGMSHGEIAAATNMPVGTVKSNIRRGTQQLQQLLSAYDQHLVGEQSP
jgi:RNA polymerase sigma-70 factor (ECF subfamily)